MTQPGATEPGNELLRSLFDNASEIFVVVDRTGVARHTNQAFTRILGYEPEELAGHRLTELFHPSDADELREALETPGMAAELRVRHCDGYWVHVDLLVGAAPLEDEGCLVTLRDATESRLSREALESSEEKFRALFEESQDAIVIGTVEGQILDVNLAGVELFGYDSKEQMLNMNIGRDLYWNPKDRQLTEADFRTQGFVKNLIVDLKHRSGRRIRVEESASAMRDRSGEIIGFRGVLREITGQEPSSAAINR